MKEQKTKITKMTPKKGNVRQCNSGYYWKLEIGGANRPMKHNNKEL